MREDGTAGPYSPYTLRSNYTSNMAGTWVWKPDSAFAVLTDAGELIFFRSETASSGTDKTVTDIMGNNYTGRVYDYVETDTSSVSKWFNQRQSIKSVRVADGQIIKPATCSSWFSSCSNLISCDFTWLDTSRVTSMSNMFSGCSGLVSLDVSNFNTINVTNMSSMFSGCSGLVSS